MDIKKFWLELTLVLIAAVALLAIAIPVLAAHWLLLTGVTLALTSPKTIPLAWSAFKEVSGYIDDKRIQNEQLTLMESVRERLLLGDDTEYNNAVTGISFKLSLPRREVTVEEVEEEPLLEIEAPRESSEHLNISDDYQPHADEFLSARKLVVGVSGSGKSNSTATICEELGRFDVPMVLADTENEYQPLGDKRWLPNGMLVDNRKLNVDNASHFGVYVLENNIQAIINLQSYDMEEAAWVMVNLIQGLNQWQEERSNDSRIPCEFLLEEATTWLPQNVKESPLNDSEVMARLQSAFFNDLVRKGRKRGLGLTVICQKIAEIDKRALQCDVKLLHRQTELNDLQKYAKMGISNEETLSLQNGEGYYFSSRASKMLIQVRKRYSEHGANTPGLASLRAHQQGRTKFGDNSEFRASSESVLNQFDRPRERSEWDSSDGSTDFSNTVASVQKRVPETTRNAILDLYRNGTKRKDIQGILDLNGDEYWMIKVVCDEHDKRGE